MEESTVRNVMIILAMATPIVGGLLLWITRMAAAESGEPMPPGMRRNAWILILAGPLSLILWPLFNWLLAGVGYRSVIGYILAAVVFIAGGMTTGFFTRLWEKKSRK